MFNELIARWQSYMEATNELPYDAIKVQGLGIKFADEWNRLESSLRIKFEGLDKDWGYYHRVYVPKLIEENR